MIMPLINARPAHAATAPASALRWALCIAPVMGTLLASLAQAAEGGVVYRCPGPPVLYTDALSAQEAQKRGCHSIEGTPITVVQSAKPRSGAAASAAKASEARIEAAEQRARDSDARRILESELKKEEDRLVALQKDYNNGEPERTANERNFAKYQERVAELKAAITRKEGDIAALRRELDKLPR